MPRCLGPYRSRSLIGRRCCSGSRLCSVSCALAVCTGLAGVTMPDSVTLESGVPGQIVLDIDNKNPDAGDVMAGTLILSNGSAELTRAVNLTVPVIGIPVLAPITTNTNSALVSFSLKNYGSVPFDLAVFRDDNSLAWYTTTLIPGLTVNLQFTATKPVDSDTSTYTFTFAEVVGPGSYTPLPGDPTMVQEIFFLNFTMNF